MRIYIKSGNRSESERIDDGYKKRHQLDISPQLYIFRPDCKICPCTPSIMFLIASLRNHDEVQRTEVKGSIFTQKMWLITKSIVCCLI